MDTQSLSKESMAPKEAPTIQSKGNAPFGEPIVVHNGQELLQKLSSNKHFLLMPGGDYDLYQMDGSVNPTFIDGVFEKLENIIIEGQGEAQVDFFTESSANSVLNLVGCSNITLKNLNLGYDFISRYIDCNVPVLELDDCKNITLENCTLSGGAGGISAFRVDGLKCTNVVIKDCTEKIFILQKTQNALFNHCEFINKKEELLHLFNAHNIKFENSRLEGYVVDYPNILWDDDIMLINHPSDGTAYVIKEEQFESVRLKNVTVAGKSVLKELEALHPSVKPELNLWYDEFSGDLYVECLMNYSSALQENEYLPQIEQAKQIISQRAYVFGNVYVRLSWPGNEEGIESDYEGVIRISDTDTDIFRLMNDNRAYLSSDEALRILKAWWPPLLTIYGNKAVNEVLDISYMGIFVEYGEPYYHFSVSSDYGYYADFGGGYSVHAVDGSIHTRFDLNNFAKLKWATKEQIEAVLAYIMSQGIEIAEDAAYRAYSLSGDSDEIAFVILMNDYAGSDYFIKYENDNLLVEPYAQWTSP